MKIYKANFRLSRSLVLTLGLAAYGTSAVGQTPEILNGKMYSNGIYTGLHKYTPYPPKPFWWGLFSHHPHHVVGYKSHVVMTYGKTAVSSNDRTKKVDRW